MYAVSINTHHFFKYRSFRIKFKDFSFIVSILCSKSAINATKSGDMMASIILFLTLALKQFIGALAVRRCLLFSATKLHKANLCRQQINNHWQRMISGSLAAYYSRFQQYSSYIRLACVSLFVG